MSKLKKFMQKVGNNLLLATLTTVPLSAQAPSTKCGSQKPLTEKTQKILTPHETFYENMKNFMEGQLRDEKITLTEIHMGYEACLHIEKGNKFFSINYYPEMEDSFIDKDIKFLIWDENGNAFYFNPKGIFFYTFDENRKAIPTYLNEKEATEKRKKWSAWVQNYIQDEAKKDKRTLDAREFQKMAMKQNRDY